MLINKIIKPLVTYLKLNFSIHNLYMWRLFIYLFSVKIIELNTFSKLFSFIYVTFKLNILFNYAKYYKVYNAFYILLFFIYIFFKYCSLLKNSIFNKKKILLSIYLTNITYSYLLRFFIYKYIFILFLVITY